MSLALTPLNDAWTIKKPTKKSEKRNVAPQNKYSSPQIQNKILQELGMIETYEEPIQQDIQESNTLQLTLTNKDLIEFFKPYSNDYIEAFIFHCMSKPKQENNTTMLSPELFETIENIYLVVCLIMVLVIIDILLRLRKN